MSAYDKMAYGALGQFIDVDDNDKDSDDETVIADDDDDDDNDDIEQGTTHAPLMETRNRTQAENETRRKRTAEFVFGTESRVQLQTIRHLREELDILMSLGENDALPGSSAHSQSGESSTTDGDYFSVLDSLSTENNSHVTDSSNLEQFALLTSSLGGTGANSLDDDFDREITLRDYQVEVIEPAREGQNVIIILPTGTGKTHPVIKYAQEHLSSKGQLRRVVFLAPKVKLALFQYFRFLHYFPQQTYFRCGKVRSSCAPFSELLQTYKVFVMTPMCLVEAVHHGELELADFSLLVLDECHHAALGRHAYRVLMDLYVDVKLAPRTTAATEADSSSVAATTAAVALPPLPQVVGLTASPGVGQAKTVEAAMIHIRDLCFIMDVECLGVPRTHQQQLEDYTNQPSHEMHTCPPRKTDGFRNAVGRLMKQIEDKMVAFADLEQGQNKDSLLRVLDAPGHQRGHIRYTQWVCNLENRLMDLTISRDLTRSLISMAEMLTVYQRALALNEDCESRYALDLLQRQVDDLESRTPEHGLVERQLLDQYKCHKAELEQTCSDPEDYNPKLRMLESILRDVLDQYMDQCACMVFVRTVELSKAIQKWVENHPVLKQLKPGRVTGTRRGQDERGMTRNEAAEVLNKFNSGEHGMVVCTSAAEEGLDFQACNIVIRYDYVTSMISMVQTRGRARRMDSQYCVLGGTPQGNLVKEQENLALERLMRTALHRQKDAMDRNPNAFRHASNLWQQQWYRERREKERSATLRRERAQTTTEDIYRLLCRKCRTEVCLSTDLRVLEEAPNAVVGGVLGDRCTRKDLGEPEHYKQHLEKVARLDCSNCGRAWGSVNRYIPTGREFPLLKLEYFILLNLTTGQLNKAKLKWGKAPFRESVLPISEEELGLM